MKHKILFYSPLVAIVILLSAGCKKQFLEVPAQGQIDEEAVLRDPEAAGNLVTGVYNTLYQGSFGPTTVGFLYCITLDEASDDADPGSIPGDNSNGEKIANFTATSNVSFFDNLWRGNYAGINQANKALDILNRATFEENIKNRLKGEVSYLRGFYYFNLVRMFGGVPLITSVPGVKDFKSDSLVTRVPKEAIYNSIISDLQFAVDNLPLKGDANTQVGRATKGAAQGLLAKVYMYLEDWQKVYDLTDEVITSGLYSLVKNKADTLTDYNLIFREKSSGGVGGNNNSESVFEVQTGIEVTENAVSPLYSNGQGPRGKGGWNDLGFGWNTPSAGLAGAYEAGDTRRAGTIIFINPTVNPGGTGNSGTVLWDGLRLPSLDSVANSRYNYKVYVSPTAESAQQSGSKDKKPKNIRLMRFAEILLMHAEAAVNLSNQGEALRSVNKVRNRAGLPSLTTVTKEAVWDERRFELAMEQNRFFDLVRTGKAAAILGPRGFVAGKNEVFPIPQAQIDLSNGKMTQNPNY